MTRESVVKEIGEKLKTIAPWAKTILYGSEARGEAEIDSDIDLLILVPDELKDDFTRIRCNITDELYEIELKNDTLISPLILLQTMWTSKVTPFTINVNKDGIEL